MADGITVLDAISPKQWPMKAGCDQPALGILLIHGLSDGPYAISDLGDHFSQSCVLVRSVLLPGHSTVAGDLAHVSYQDWIDASSWAMESFSGEVDKLVVVGFSTGATLAIDYAIRKQNREANRVPLIKTGDSRSFNGDSSQVVGLVLLSPAIAIKTSAAFITRWVDKLGVALYEPLRWAAIRDDLDYAKYESFHMNAAAQIYMLTKRLGSTLDMKHPVPVPVFVVASEQDTTIDTSETIQFFHNRTDQQSEMLLYASQDLQTGDSRIEVRNSANVEDKILSQSHISIPNSPANPHYGKNGDYFNCVHYSDDPQLSRCLDRNNSDVLYGEITDKNTAQGIVRRISWNPDYEYMMNRIDQFINTL
ncbi:MAG: alpha/beta fold hydrolase [Pseudomonadales bacterium]|nr:alpha/beta fold hydrolase [Pseudomonadales bacterium]